MTVIQAFILGLVQGVTEFLPISSSGFLILVPEWFGWAKQPLAFDATLHLATLAAVFVALWSDVKSLVVSRSPVLKQILIATIPALILGFLFHDVIESTLRSTSIVALSFVIWGLALLLADRYAKESVRGLSDIGFKRSVLIGIAQAIALIPGTSRSGITITAGLFGGLTRNTAIRFSFLLSIPTIFIAGAYSATQLATTNETTDIWPIAIGMTSAFIFAILTIRLLLAFVKRYSFTSIAIFRIVLGLLLLLSNINT